MLMRMTFDPIGPFAVRAGSDDISARDIFVNVLQARTFSSNCATVSTPLTNVSISCGTRPNPLARTFGGTVLMKLK